jgi:hypothetical protein
MRIVCALLLVVALASSAEVRMGQFQGRAAWTIDAPRLRVTILQWGGHVAEIVLKEAGGLNPLWIQSRPTIEPDQYVAAKHEKLYDGGPAAKLLSGIMGHNVCFPFWGNPSEAEYAAGMTYHGETGITRWTQVAATPETLTLSVELPESRTRFTRAVRVAGQVVWFNSTATNESTWDRPVGWCEHVTLGPPFLERQVTTIDASLTLGQAYGRELNWPSGADETGAVDLGHIRQQGPVLVNHFQVDPQRQWGFFVVLHPGRRLLFGYAFARADFPWLNVWEANNSRMLARGMEFSNTPVHGTMKALVNSPRLFGLPTFEWLEAKSKLEKRFCAFAAQVAEGYRGVADVLVRGDNVIVVEKGGGELVLR